MQTFLESPSAAELLSLHLPRYAELPALELYKDQVISVTTEVLRPLFPQSSDPILTPTMINNYVRQKLVQPPIKKRYTRDHLAYFIVVALMKQVFSMAEIGSLLQRQIDIAVTDVAYDRFCTELEDSIKCILGGALQQQPLPLNGQADLLRATVISLVNKIYVVKFLEFSGQPSQK